MVRILNIWPRLRGLAGPAPDLHEPEPESDTHLQLIRVPADTDVSNSSHFLALLFDVSKYQDPLHTLLEYIAEVSISIGSSYMRISLYLGELYSKILLVMWFLSMTTT